MPRHERPYPADSCCEGLNMVNTLIISWGIIFLLGLLYYEKKNNRRSLLIVKSTLSLLFVVTALLQPHSVPAYFYFLLVGLIFCLVEMSAWLFPTKRPFG